MPVCCEISLLKATRSDKARMAMPTRSQNPPETQRGDLDVSPRNSERKPLRIPAISPTDAERRWFPRNVTAADFAVPPRN